MKLIVGLGNPGNKYQLSRHNFGFILLDNLAEELEFSFQDSPKFKAEIVQVRDPDHDKIIYLKPQTYMNLSGQSVGAVAQFYKILLEDILVIFDDVDMPFGKMRFARGGGSGGHKGIKSITQALGTQDFPRFKLGIGRPEIVHKDVSDHVLERFSSEEFDKIDEILKTAVDAFQIYLKDGLDRAMNLFN